MNSPHLANGYPMGMPQISHEPPMRCPLAYHGHPIGTPWLAHALNDMAHGLPVGSL